jgi:hypothetical protein
MGFDCCCSPAHFAIGNNKHVTRDTTETDQRDLYSLYLVKDSIEPLHDKPILQIHSAGYLICEMSNRRTT